MTTREDFERFLERVVEQLGEEVRASSQHDEKSCVWRWKMDRRSRKFARTAWALCKARPGSNLSIVPAMRHFTDESGAAGAIGGLKSTFCA